MSLTFTRLFIINCVVCAFIFYAFLFIFVNIIFNIDLTDINNWSNNNIKHLILYLLISPAFIIIVYLCYYHSTFYHVNSTKQIVMRKLNLAKNIFNTIIIILMSTINFYFLTYIVQHFSNVTIFTSEIYNFIIIISMYTMLTIICAIVITAIIYRYKPNIIN